MFSTLVTAPIASVFTVAEAKEQSRIDTSADDSRVQAFIDRATAYFDARDGVTGEALISQTWRLTLASGEFKSGIALPIGPAQSITSIECYIDGTLTALGTENYRLTDGKVYLTETGSMPSVDAREDAVQITYVAGYGDAGSDVPETTRNGIALLTAYLYDHRDASEDSGDAPNFAFSAMLAASRSARGMF